MGDPSVQPRFGMFLVRQKVLVVVCEDELTDLRMAESDSRPTCCEKYQSPWQLMCGKQKSACCQEEKNEDGR